MRVLIINTSERTGGAAIAANRLMEALKNNGIKAKMLVRDRSTNEVTVVALKKSWRRIWQFVWERCVIWATNGFHKHNLFAVDIANTGTDITGLPEFVQADVIHLHWINQGMLSLKDIEKIVESGKPVVWTLHDMWPFTGICHYAGSCDKYTTQCQQCELLQHPHHKDLSYKIFGKKEKLYSKANITFVACSHWLEGIARQSALLKGQEITSIPNAINTNLFTPRPKRFARQKLKLPEDKKLLLFGSMKITDKRKGIDYLIEACKLIAQSNPELSKKLGVVVLGSQAEQYASLFPFPIYQMNYVSTEKELVDIYNAVDLYVTPSLQDNLPNTIVEAMACGIPCVGFNVGGIPQMIDHLHNGYVAQYKSAEDLANGICWSFSEGDYASLSEEARRKALNSYSERNVAMKYIKIYNQITGDNA
ncbi:glycosyltransferase family 4 protein [uncultured Bacteroides sp.]|uniref:glycosyltransferase family 4 protein n=1 Tax=uncultured Bacteroides sp. TaxID=162156 RepID=UPI002602C2A2|nr:glycosyltransferase family 4 protein [uncultured Bacteroides sp.]